MTSQPSDDRQILVNYEEAADSDGVLDNGFGDAHRGSISSAIYPVDDTGSGSIPDSELQKFQPSVPVDRFNFTYLIFYLLGTATMVPWNFFITAEDYWLYKFRNTTFNGTSPDLTPMQKSFTSDLTVTASISGTIFLVLNAIWGHHVSIGTKMLGTMGTILALFIVTTAFVEVDTDDWQAGFFLMTLGTVVVINISSAVMSGALFGIAGLFPSEYMTAVVSGQALGGIFTALAFIMALTFGASGKTTAFVYFSIGSAIVLVSIVTYVIMSRTKYFTFHVHRKSCAVVGPVDGVELEPKLGTIFGKIYLYAICICLTFVVSLSVYPAVTVLVKSQYFGNGHLWNDVYFLPVVNYLVFNSGDYFGRILCGLIELPRNNPHLVLLFTVVRIIFIPLFLTANVVPHYFLPTIIHSDIAFILLMVAFAISNGYLTNITLIMVPRIVMQQEKEIASSIMAASLSLGIALGSIFSMVLVQLL